MSLIDKTDPAQHEALAFELELAHAPEKVWRTLTEPELLRRWLLPVKGLQLEPGTEFCFEAPPQRGWDGVVHCRVLELVPLEKIRYGWVVGDLDTVVSFTLTATATGTRLALLHTGFKPTQKHNFAGARYGWAMMGGKLIELLPSLA